MSAKRSDETLLGSAGDGRYTVLYLDELALVVPQHEVRTLEPAFDVTHPEGGEVGSIAVAGTNWPVYCLSEDLRPIRVAPAERRICVLLESSAGLLGVLCDEVVMLEQDEWQTLPLPECMHTPDTPIGGMLLQGDRALCVTSVAGLLACIGQQQGPAAEPGPPQRLQGSLS